MTRRSTVYAPGAIVVVDFPTYDPALAGAPKRRPAVVVSSDTFMSFDDDVVVCPVTTGTIRAFDVKIDWRNAGLPRPCVVRPKPTTLPPRALHALVGALTPHDLDNLRAALSLVLGVPQPPDDPDAGQTRT